VTHDRDAEICYNRATLISFGAIGASVAVIAIPVVVETDPGLMEA
jgi:hypothetical protein